MGTQKTVKISEELPDDLGSPAAEHHGKSKEKVKSTFRHSKEKVTEKIKAAKFKKEKNIEEKKVEETKESVEENPTKEINEAEKKPVKKEKVGKSKIRSKKYQTALNLIDRDKKYSINEAIELAKKTSLTSFDGNVEAHIRLLNKSGKPESLRGILKYPHPTGKKIIVTILDEKVAENIEKTGKAEADIYLATPDFMPKIGKLAKILGPKGKMPSPKSGTITDNPEATKRDLEAGQVEYKTDSGGNIHQVIGKVSAEDKNLEENFQALLSVVPVEKINTLVLCATMRPSIKVLGSRSLVDKKRKLL